MDFASLLQNPAVLGAVITAALKWLHTAFVTFDKGDIAEKFGPQLHVAFLVLSFIATVIHAAETKTLSSVDLTNLGAFAQYWVTFLIGGKAMSVSNGVNWRETITGK